MVIFHEAMSELYKKWTQLSKFVLDSQSILTKLNLKFRSFIMSVLYDFSKSSGLFHSCSILKQMLHIYDSNCKI